MAWLAVNRNGKGFIFGDKPHREISRHFGDYWETTWTGKYVELPKGSIKKLIGRELKWEDSPVEI